MRSPSRLIAAVLAVFALTACGPEPERLNDLHGEVLLAPPLHIVAGPRWEVDQKGTWLFRNRADVVACRRDVSTPADLVLRPAEGAKTSAHGLEVRRGSRTVWTGQVGDGVSFEALSAGGERCARFEVVRRYDLDREGEAEFENRFAAIGLRSGNVSAESDPAARDADRPIFRLVRDEVDGVGSVSRSGILALGPRTAKVPLGAGRLIVEPENRSIEPAVFRVEGAGAAEVRVEPGATGRLEVAVDGDTVLAVEGTEDGRFFWGAPRVVPERGGDRLRAIVLVTLDTTRRDVLAPWSGSDEVTPFLGELATGSVVFDDAWTTAPWTLPSHASIFTGLWPSRHGAGVSEMTLPAGIPTLARLLRDAGWTTLGFAGGDLCSSRFGTARGFLEWLDPEQFEIRGDRLLEAGREALDRFAEEERPIFLFLNFFDAHALWQAPELYRERFGVEELAGPLRDQEGWGRLLEGELPAWRGAIEGEFPVTPEARAWMDAAYRAEVAFVDDLLRDLVDDLMERGWWDRTLFAVTSDHGELLGEHGFVSHGARLDPELVSAPLLLRVPGESPRRESRLVSNVDLFPTLLRAAGITPPPSDGRGLLGEPERRPWVLAEEHEFLVHPLPAFQKIAPHLYGLQRTGHRHLVWDGGEECGELRGEVRDGRWVGVPCEVPGAEVLSALEDALGGLGSSDGTPVGEPDGALAESLEALGYM